MSHSSWRSDLALSEEKDKLENYDIVQQLADSGRVFCILEAKCTRGRLKGRAVVLKRRSHDYEDIGVSDTLHQALYHPNIISLFSTFSSPQHRYQVLEFCPAGTLSDLLQTQRNSTLHEADTRTIVKPLLDALSYLSKEAIVHRNINPDHVLLTADRRVKLSSFTLATRLPSQDETNEWFLQTPDFVSPEILSRKPYNCSSDLWSLGVIIYRCVSGELPFQTSSGNVLSNILRARYTIPSSVSSVANDLIKGLLDPDLSNRLHLRELLKHPFFGVKSKSTSNDNPQEALHRPPLKPSKPRPFAFRAPLSQRVTTNNKSDETPRVRLPLRETQNADLRRILSDEVSTGSLKVGGRRIASDPTLKASEPLDDLHLKPKLKSSSLKLSRPSVNTTSTLSSIYRSSTSKTGPQLRPELPTASEFSGDDSSSNGDARSCDEDLDALPIGTSRPSALKTGVLPPRTHKTVNGTLTILSSRSLFVDFREGERRRGQRGKEVIVISSSGDTIEIHEEPDVTPGHLLQPSAVYTLETLPRRYWKPYNDANTLLTRIKQRTPKVVFYDYGVRCTLMANDSPGDVEVLYLEESSMDADSRPQTPNAKHQYEQPNRRLRYSRQEESLEIASYIPQGKEWKTRTLHAPMHSLAILDNLDQEERDSVSRLICFLRTAELLESAHKSHNASVEPAASTSTWVSHSSAPDLGSSRTMGRSLSTLDLAPRPPKFSTSISKPEMLSLGKKNSLATDIAQTLNLKATDMTPTWCKDDSLGIPLNTSGIQSKFIPSVGWCIRHGSRVSQGGRYKIMFLDGAVLDVDVDEEWVEFTYKNGYKQRRTIRDCHSERALGDRMKVFEEFVSMYDVKT